MHYSCNLDSGLIIYREVLLIPQINIQIARTVFRSELLNIGRRWGFYICENVPQGMTMGLKWDRSFDSWYRLSFLSLPGAVSSDNATYFVA